MNKRVLVTEPIHKAGLELLYSRDDVDVVELPDASPETICAALPGTHGIAVRTARLTAEMLSLANELQVVSRHGVGCDTIAVDHLTGRGIPVAIASGANSRSVAEHTLALMFSLARELPTLDTLVKQGRWSERNNYRARDLHGANVLIIGFGRIGRTVAPLCKALGMEVTVADIALDEALAESSGYRGVWDFRPELPKADFVSLHVPLDDSTRNLIALDELKAMKETAILINCARGGVVDEGALFTALDQGLIAAAGVDVFDQEPAPDGHPLFSRPDVLLSPHNAAASHLSVEAMARMAAQNILDYFDGRLRDDCIFNPEALAAAGNGQLKA